MTSVIDTRYIVAVYALNQWLEVKPNTFERDFPILGCLSENKPFDFDEHGNLKPTKFDNYETLFGENEGVSFIDASTGLEISLALNDIKAYKYQTPEEIIKVCPELKQG